MHGEINGCIGFYPLLISLAEAGEHSGWPGRDPTLLGALGRGGSKENHPGLNRNPISQAQHRAALDDECALEEQLLIPMSGFGFVTDNAGSPAVTWLSTAPN